MSGCFNEFFELLQKSQTPFFAHLVRGLEKESLRVNTHGQLSQRPHPETLGKSLTHRFFTTDFAESQLEMVTPPAKTMAEFFHFFDNAHRYLYQKLAREDEMLWPSSMPGDIDEAHIALAEFGPSHPGQFAEIYRRGLTRRYGKKMQVISGIHYNFSLPPSLIEFFHQQGSYAVMARQDFQDRLYFRLVRNFRRAYPVLLYLFGATPATSASSLPEKLPSFLQKGLGETLIGEWTTSLRMSGFGYHNPIQRTIQVRYDNLQTYVQDLREATQTPYLKYMEIGEFENGKRIQLNANLLQIENEYYSPVRPKQVVEHGERQLNALQKRGVAYVEVRIVDINPFLPNSIEPHLLPFLDVFLTYCLLEKETCLSREESQEFHDNLKNIALFGRKPDLMLSCQGKKIPFREWLYALYEELLTIANLMDHLSHEKIFTAAVLAQRAKMDDPERTPSAQVLQLLTTQSYQDAMLHLAKAHRDAWLSSAPDADISTLLDEEKIKSLQNYEALLKQSPGSFENYLAAYFK